LSDINKWNEQWKRHSEQLTLKFEFKKFTPLKTMEKHIEENLRNTQVQLLASYLDAKRPSRAPKKARNRKRRPNRPKRATAP
jgi:hypothetical protein